MKKCYLILIIFISLQVQGQFFEGFEGAFPPAGWAVADNGVGTGMSWRANIPPFPTYEGTKCAYIDRENIGPGNTSEDWLITPAITIGTNAPLTFFSRQTLMGDTGTFYQIKISTTSQTDHSSFTTLNGWDETDLNPGIDYESKIVSLNAYVGQTVYIAFVRIHSQIGVSTSGDRWLLDNVSIGSTNLINGNVQFSMDGSCGMTSTPLYDNINIQAQYNTNVDNVFTNTNGHYTYTTLQNDFTLTPNLSIGSYFNITPANYNFNFPNIGSTGTANFCITPNGIHPDLEITVLPYTNAVPSFNARYTIVYKNKGNQIQSGTVTLNFNDAIMDFVNSYPNIDTQSTGTLTWNFTDLKPFESSVITASLNLNSPIETPPVNIGDVINSTAEITASQPDETPSDNISSLSQIVEASYDPNDKIVTEGSVIDISKVGEYLHYMIRFQNIGTADATNVVVRDILTDNLDASTFEMMATSHPCSTSKRGNQLEFAFDNIHLPSSVVDEPGSHGFVAFKIKPAATVGVGSVIENTASIYFDFNFPIVTNTTSTTVATLGTQSFVDGKYFTLHPNPARNVVNLNINDAITVQSITIYNTLGQIVKTVSLSEFSSSITVDVSQLKTGTYFIQVDSNRGKMTKKLVKI